MRSSLTIDKGLAALSFALDGDDSLHGRGQWDMPIELITDNAMVQLSEPIDPHPDLRALAVLMVIRPWVGRSLRLNTPVSTSMAEKVAAVFAIEMLNVDPQLSPREPGSRPGLAYSAGPDCLAAAAVMSERMPLFHYTRVRHHRVPNRATHVRSDVQLAIVREAEHLGHELLVTSGDVEFLTRPFPTFAHWVTMAIGAVLQADSHDLGAIVFGRHIAGAFVHSGQRFDPDADWDRQWRSMFQAAGLDLVLPSSAITELMTPIVAAEHDLFQTRRSCLLGTKDRPCGACAKCLRKSLIDWYHDMAPFPADVLTRCSDIPAIAGPFLTPATIPQKHVYARILTKAPDVSGTLLEPARRYLEAPGEATDWVEKFYPKALTEYVPERWRDGVTAKMKATVAEMTAEETRIVEMWPSVLSGLAADEL